LLLISTEFCSTHGARSDRHSAVRWAGDHACDPDAVLDAVNALRIERELRPASRPAFGALTAPALGASRALA
jgi:hypothetical protein